MRIKVHVEGIKGSSRIKDGEESTALFNGVLEIDGHLVDEVSEIEVVFKGGDFASVRPSLIPGSFEVVTHTDESWPELRKQIDDERQARAGTGRLVAETPG
jgi:hypothetical protein